MITTSPSSAPSRQLQVLGGLQEAVAEQECSAQECEDIQLTATLHPARGNTLRSDHSPPHMLPPLVLIFSSTAAGERREGSDIHDLISCLSFQNKSARLCERRRLQIATDAAVH